MLLCANHSRTWVALAILFASLLGGEAIAERRRFTFERAPSSLNRGVIGNGRLFVGTGENLDGASNLVVINKNQTFNIGGDGRLLGVREQRSDGLQQDLAVSAGGQIFGLGGLRPEAKTVQDIVTQFGKNRNQSNRRGTVDAIVARNTGNAAGVLGQFRIDLSSIPDPRGGAPGSASQLQFALATLNSLLNSLSNSSTLLRVFPQNIRRDADGKPIVNLNLRGFFSAEALNIMANADQSSACTGRIRLQSFAATAMDKENYYRIKGIEGFNRQQIYDALGVEADKRRTIKNKILIAARRDPNRKESGVTSSAIGRVSKFMNMGNNPGGTCYESDDFTDRAAPGAETNSRDVKQVGINYTQDASEALCHQRNGFMLGMLFNSKGDLVKEAPASIALGTTTGNTNAVTAALSCMDCHAKGFLAGGKRVHQGDGQFYDDNFDLIKNNPTVFRDQFGRQLGGRDFFTSNQVYRQRANRDTAIYFRALAKSGSLIVDPATNYPMPLVPLTVAEFNKRQSNKQMASELGVSEAAFAGLVGGGNAGADRRNFDNAYCGLRAKLGAGRGSSFLAENNGRAGQTARGFAGFRHNPGEDLATSRPPAQ